MPLEPSASLDFRPFSSVSLAQMSALVKIDSFCDVLQRIATLNSHSRDQDKAQLLCALRIQVRKFIPNFGGSG
jgi:hypothetical protein